MRNLLVWALFLTAPLSALADADIPAGCRVPNENPGYCMWCSLEMMGRAQHVVALSGLKENRKRDGGFVLDDQFYPAHGGHPVAVYLKLTDLKVPFTMQWPGNKDMAILVNALKRGHGVAIGIHIPQGYHAVVLTKLTAKKVEYLDPNSTANPTQASREWFDEVWDGYAVTIEQEGTP